MDVRAGNLASAAYIHLTIVADERNTLPADVLRNLRKHTYVFKKATQVRLEQEAAAGHIDEFIFLLINNRD